MDKRRFAVQLFEAGAIKFGEFRLKTGVLSPVYVDLRVLISRPDIVEQLSDQLGQLSFDNESSCQLICGVPYTAIPFASCLSVRKRIPMLMRRKEAKEHGTKQMIEGHYKPGQRTLVIEDILSSGTTFEIEYFAFICRAKNMIKLQLIANIVHH
jgi:uridine monophosphate synthetase